MLFWTSALQVAAKMDRMKTAETKLLALAREFGDREPYSYKITTMDTSIPRTSVFPSLLLLQDKSNKGEEEDALTIHAVKVQSVSDDKNKKKKTPLVLLHGYMNAAAYFYRNLVGLTHYFESVYSLDMLGWGLSSRPDFHLVDQNNNSNTKEHKDDIQLAEDFFVESLEAWRVRNHIDKMILAGHSMGGYMSVAYAERYPQHVEQLLLISPVGVPEESPDVMARRDAMSQASWRFWLLRNLAQNVFHFSSAGAILRTMPEKQGHSMILNYVQKRLPAITDPHEQYAVAEYLYANNILPGSGEHCINRVLTPFAYAKKPQHHRIPQLQVQNITFLYGSQDWMEPQGGLSVQQQCQQSSAAAGHPNKKTIKVYEISRAGHLLMLENWKEFNAAIMLGAGASLDDLPASTPLPTLLQPTATANNTNSAPSSSRRPFRQLTGVSASHQSKSTTTGTTEMAS
jgi:cardiolipin-specific phospholipase